MTIDRRPSPDPRDEQDARHKDTPPWADAPNDRSGPEAGFARPAPTGEGPHAKERIGSAGAEDAATSRAVQALLSQTRRDTLMALQRLEDVERRAALDSRLQDDRLHLRLAAIGECRHRLIAVLPLSPGGGPAPLPWREGEQDASFPGQTEDPSIAAPAANLPSEAGTSPRWTEVSETGARAAKRGRGQRRLSGVFRDKRLAVATAALAIVATAYLLGSLERQAASNSGVNQSTPSAEDAETASSVQSADSNGT